MERDGARSTGAPPCSLSPALVTDHSSLGVFTPRDCEHTTLNSYQQLLEMGTWVEICLPHRLPGMLLLWHSCHSLSYCTFVVVLQLFKNSVFFSPQKVQHTNLGSLLSTIMVRVFGVQHLVLIRWLGSPIVILTAQ